MITKTYDELVFKLVPVELTPGMIIALNDMCIDAVLARDVLPIIETGYKAMLAVSPTPPAEQQGEQEPVATVVKRVRRDSGETHIGVEIHVGNHLLPGTLLYTRPAPSLAELRARVEALPRVDGAPVVWKADVLAEIDKMGGGV